MMLRRYHWPSLTLAEPPTTLRLAKARPREKNWSPFVAPSPRLGGAPRVLISYQLEPHIVISCHPAGGQCRRRYESSAKALWAQRVAHYGRMFISGGTPRVIVGGAPTCIAHYIEWVPWRPPPSPPGAKPAPKPSNAHLGPYVHIWYALSPDPPYQVRRVSHPFRFAPFFNDRRDRVQYAAGLASSSDGKRLIVSYGVGDCLAAEINVTSTTVQRLLDGDPDVSAMGTSPRELDKGLPADSPPCAHECNNSYPVILGTRSSKRQRADAEVAATFISEESHTVERTALVLSLP